MTLQGSHEYCWKEGKVRDMQGPGYTLDSNQLKYGGEGAVVFYRMP